LVSRYLIHTEEQTELGNQMLSVLKLLLRVPLVISTLVQDAFVQARLKELNYRNKIGKVYLFRFIFLLFFFFSDKERIFEVNFPFNNIPEIPTTAVIIKIMTASV